MLYDVDFAQTVTHLEFAAGYAGIGLGLKRVIRNLRAIAYVEIEAFAVANLVAKMESGLLPVAPVWTNIKTFPCKQFHGIVDILSAGYPCQGFSLAGKRKGAADPRHLWPYIRTAIGIIQPGCCFFENVEGHITSGLSAVLSDLGGLDYEVEAGIFSAEEVGAPHQRKRVFILGIREGYELEDRYCVWKSQPEGGFENERGWAVNTGEEGGEPLYELPDSLQSRLGDADPGREPGWEQENQNRPTGPVRTVWPARTNEAQPGWEPPRTVGKPAEQGLQDGTVGKSQKETTKESERSGSGELGNAEKQQRRRISNRKNGKGFETGRSGESRTGRPTESPMGGDVDGHPDRLDYAGLYQSGDNHTDELRLCGNGVVPATVEKAFRTLYESLTR